MTYAWIAEDGTRRLTVTDLKDIVSRAKSVIEESEGADEHADLIGELGAVVALAEDVAMDLGPDAVLVLRTAS